MMNVIRIYGTYDNKINNKGYVDSLYGEIFMSIDELYRYLESRDYTYKNMTLIAWLPSVKEIKIVYDRLYIAFENHREISLFNEEVSDYLSQCIKNEYK